MSKERAILLPDWPQPNAGAPMPITLADDTSLIVRYFTQTEKVAVIYFSVCSVFTFGSPNDEGLAGHPLYRNGLQFYSVHTVENSSWIALLEKRNSVHSCHDRDRFLENKKHYIFTFHDSTLECVVNERFGKPAVMEFATEAEADEFIDTKRKA